MQSDAWWGKANAAEQQSRIPSRFGFVNAAERGRMTS
jgi:hypothetical protein